VALSGADIRHAEKLDAATRTPDFMISRAQILGGTAKIGGHAN
jgi:hypothetical protein